MDPPQTASDHDATISAEHANAVGVLVLLGVGLLFVTPYVLVWGGSALLALLEAQGSWALLLFLLTLTPAIAVHEALHGVGFWRFGQVGWQAIHFGCHWRRLMPFARCRVPLQVAAYRRAVLLPGLVLGVIPAAVGIVVGNGWLMLWGGLMLVAAAGDIAVWWAVRRLPAATLVLDHPTKIGCEIVPPSQPLASGSATPIHAVE